ncbi:MFS transporter [Escherichia coli]
MASPAPPPPTGLPTRSSRPQRLTMLNTLGCDTFWVYAALNVLFILLTLWLVLETKHVSLEQIPSY